MDKWTDNYRFFIGRYYIGAINEVFLIPTIRYSSNSHLREHITEDGTGRWFRSLTLCWLHYRVKVTRYYPDEGKEIGNGT